MNRQVTEAFDALADRYEKETDGIRPYNAFYERPAMMRILPDDLSGLHVLDAGCAAGWYSEQLIRLGARVTAVDASPRMVEAAKRRVGDRADVRLHNLEDPLPFETEQFDWIVCSLTLHYLPDWTSVFAEFAKVLKPNGRLLFSTHHPFMDFVQFDQTDYFALTLLRDQWTAGDQKVEVPFYRRPLGRIFADTLQWFDVEKVVEPQPIEELKQVDLAVYERLMTQPAFLIIQGRKKRTLARESGTNQTERKRDR